MQKISFIVPVYNAEKSIKKCIKSIQNQMYENIEIICVNDGSEDNSLSVLNELNLKDRRIRVINQQNSGAFNARKTGILASTGDYIMFVDADDELCSRNACNIIIEAFNKQCAELIQFAYKKKNGVFIQKSKLAKAGLITKEDIRQKYYKDYLSSESEGVISVTLWNKAFKGEILKRVVQNSDTSLVIGEDLFLLLNYFSDQEFSNLYNINEVLYLYNVGVGYSSTLGGDVLKAYDELKEMQMKICNEWNLGDDAKYYCNLETIYFLFTVVKNMINNKEEKEQVISYINESSNYDCVLLAKNCLRRIDKKYIFNELEFLISDYAPDDYYNYCVKFVEQNPSRAKLKSCIKKLLFMH
ncbi:MAG: glycosyltransferase family 2 protein [bacterium]|nr:glycosyltransferase family 2 protein [bacterium]